VADVYADMDHWQTTSVVKALGVNGKSKADGGNNIAYDVRHQDPGNLGAQTYKVDGKDYRVHFLFCVSVYRNAK
jgi:hypothetical protein